MPEAGQVAKKPAGHVAKKPAAAVPEAAQVAKKPAAKETASESKACMGTDTEGGKYKDVGDMWSAELKDDSGRRSWYKVGEDYWHGQAASIDGVLGGYPETNGPDLRESKRFLDLLRLDGALRARPSAASRGSENGLSCLDCGAGIGRVTSGLLLEAFDLVDLVEPNERLLEAAEKELGADSRTGKFIACPLQTLDIPADSYDVIWAQWVLLYLPDDDLLSFFERCKRGMRRQGLIVIKENIVLEGKWVLDKEDNSIARTDTQMKAIFEKAGLEVAHELKQTHWPTDLIPVMMYALRLKDPEGEGLAVKRRPAGTEESPSAKARCD